MEHCRSEEDYRRILETSVRRPVFLLKHSITCGVSAMAREAFQDFEEAADRYECWELTVQASRHVSNLIAEETGVRHESPQVLLFSDRAVGWHVSHGQIRLETLREALENFEP